MTIKISLEAARVNSKMSLEEAAKKISKVTGVKLSRQRLSRWEKDPEAIPNIYKEDVLPKIYGFPKEVLFYSYDSTKRYIKGGGVDGG